MTGIWKGNLYRQEGNLYLVRENGEALNLTTMQQERIQPEKLERIPGQK